MSTAPGFSLGVADPKISQPTTPHIRPKKRMRVDCNVVDNMARLRSIEESPNWNNTAGDISGGFIRWGYSMPKLYPLLHLKAPLMNQALDLNIAWCVKAQLPPTLTPTNRLL